MPPKGPKHTNKTGVSSISDTLAREQLELERERLQLAREMLRTLGFASVEPLPAPAPAVAKAPSEPPPRSSARPAEPARKPRKPRDASKRWAPVDESEHDPFGNVEKAERDYSKTPEIHARILEQVKQHKVLTMPVLSDRLGMSKGTIDMHLKKMNERGQLVRGFVKIKGHNTTVVALSYKDIADWEQARSQRNAPKA